MYGYTINRKRNSMKKIDKYCINCNKQLWETNKTGYCRTCFNKIVKKTVKDKYCVGCGKLLNRYRPGKRCYSCNMINRRKEKYLSLPVIAYRTWQDLLSGFPVIGACFLVFG